LASSAACLIDPSDRPAPGDHVTDDFLHQRNDHCRRALTGMTLLAQSTRRSIWRLELSLPALIGAITARFTRRAERPLRGD